MKSFEQLVKEYYEPAPKEDMGSLLFEMVEDALNSDQRIDEMATLSIPELEKYLYRLPKLLDKIKAGDPFEIEKTGGKEVFVLQDPDFISALELVTKEFEKKAESEKKGALRDAFNNNFPESAFNRYRMPLFPVDHDRTQGWNGDFIALNRLRKTEDFGGEGTRKRLKKQDIAMGQLGEIIAAAIEINEGKPIVLVVPHEERGATQEFKGVIGIEEVAGNPKADFKIVRVGSLPSIYISHKDGATVRSFGQWGGVDPKKAGLIIANNPEVIEFGRRLKDRIGIAPDGKYYMPQKWTYAKKIKDKMLKYLAIFGPEYSRKGVGSVNNVDYVAQGIFKLNPYEGRRGEYVLSATHLYARSTFEGNFSPAYEPALVARYARDRRSFGIVGCRCLIYPYGGRNIAEEFTDNEESGAEPYSTEEY